MKCEHCNNTFKNNSILRHHQKTAKYCLSIQKKKGVSVSSLYNCQYCNRSMSQKIDLDRHYLSCKKKTEYGIRNEYEEKVSILTEKLTEKDEIINELKLHIEKLQDKLENIAIHAVKRSTVTNNVSNKTQINNIIQKMEPVTQKHLIDHTPNLTIEHVQKGASGYAEYALEYPLKDRVVCVDYARRKIKFKDQEGNVITDPEMAKLAPMFFENIKKKSSELVYGLNNQEMDSSMFEQVAKLFNTNADVKNCSEGIKSEFFHDFVKHVCSGSVVE
jgi:hypothetical protein